MPWAFHESLQNRPITTWQSGGISRRLAVGDLLRLKDTKANLRRAISQSVLYQSKNSFATTSSRCTAAIAALRSLEKILKRSDLCPVAPAVDACIQSELMTQFGHVINERIDKDKSEELVRLWCINRKPTKTAPPLETFDDEPEGSKYERKVWDHVQEVHEGQLRAWIHPQPSFGALLDKNTLDERRADFVVCPPWTGCLVWEVHGVLDENDTLKSNTLRAANFNVFDMVVGEAGKARVASEVSQLLPPPTEAIIEPWEKFLIDSAWVASQVDLCLSWLLMKGHWNATKPIVEFQVSKSLEPIVQAAIESWFALVRALEAIWALEPNEALLASGMSAVAGKSDSSNVTVGIDPDAPTYIAAGEPPPSTDFYIRRACFPVDVGEVSEFLGTAPPQAEHPFVEPTESALLEIMQRIFNKPGFRPGQVIAIQQALTNKDALILFPTGHGKSMVFQMASMILPGVALVIEPFRSLLDDQERNLQDNGISRIACLHSGRPLHGAALKNKLSSACMVYVAAERMHVKEFINDLVEVVRDRGINLFIIDEAHTVSQFGHSFRPAYLDLIERLETICNRAGHARPPTLALTATAALRIIRDIQALLKISHDPVSLDDLSSNSFARANLVDEIVDISINLKDEKGETKEDANKRRTSSFREKLSTIFESNPKGQGIVFCPSKRGFNLKQTFKIGEDWVIGSPLFGARGIREQIDQIAFISKVKKVTGLYTGSSDDDNQYTMDQMVKDATAFSQGAIGTMVATSAFGTGVDLPGVQWTIHVGMPNGLEGYYQESGRAGRDGSAARNILMIDWDSEDLQDAITVGASEEDPILALQVRLKSVEKRGSLARQLGLLIGFVPLPNQFNLKKPIYKTKNGVIVEKNGSKQTEFLFSFPGWKWENSCVDNQLQDMVLKLPCEGSFEFICHTWWGDLVWKSIYRLAVLGIIKHGFEHSQKKTEGCVSFLIERCNDETALQSIPLINRVVNEVERLTGEEHAAAARSKLIEHFPITDSEEDIKRRIKLATAMLLKTVYRVVYETRIESMRSLVRYAKEPDQNKRRDIIEDYFAPSDLKRQVFALCEQATTIQVLKEALRLAEAQSKWRSAIFEVAASEFTSSIVPRLLIAVSGIKANDPKECARYLFAIISNEDIQLEIRSWCYAQISTRANAVGLLSDIVNAVVLLMKDSSSFDTLATLVSQMDDTDGDTEFGNLLVAEFINKSLEQTL